MGLNFRIIDLLIEIIFVETNPRFTQKRFQFLPNHAHIEPPPGVLHTAIWIPRVSLRNAGLFVFNRSWRLLSCHIETVSWKEHNNDRNRTSCVSMI
jgi:hypothetical protein